MGDDNASVTTSGLPLAGRSVVVTRSREQSAALAGPLQDLGAEVLAFPVIATIDPEDWSLTDESIGSLGEYDWVVFTSTNAVDRFFGRIEALGRDVTALEGVRLAAVGSATADRLRTVGREAAVVPKDFRAEGLIKALKEMGAGPAWQILVPRALKGREVLPDELRMLGCRVDVVPVYRTVPAVPDSDILERLAGESIDAVTFTSPSTARYFLESIAAAGMDANALMKQVATASIGPVTSDALRNFGYVVDIEAEESTVPALVRAVATYFEGL